MKYWTEVIAIGAVVGVLAMAVVSRQNHETKSAEVPESIVNSANSFAVRDVRLFDGQHMIERANVIVRDGLIANLGPDIPIDKNLTIIDGSGRTLMPGLIDAHAHSWGDAQRNALRFGVTTEIDMHGDPARLASVKSQRESLAQVYQADLWAAGVAATVAGGHGTQYGLPFPVLDAHTDVDVFIEKKISGGSDFIKLIVEDLSAYSATQRLPTLSARQVSDVITATHQQGRLAVAHVTLQRTATEVVEADVDGLAHVFADEPVSDDFLALAKEHGIFVIPTLSVVSRASALGDAASLLADPRVSSNLSGGQLTSLKAKFSSMDVTTSNPAVAIDNVRRLHGAGIPILAGADAGNPGTAHGASLHGELELLVQAGLSPEQALRAATSLPAEVFGMSDRGRIAPGMRADLVLVDGDPSQEIRASRAIETIWKNGFVVDAKASARSDVVAETVADTKEISDFDGESIEASFGFGWQPSTDGIMGGSSTASMKRIPGGANGSAGALEIRGQIKPGFSFPWAGAMFFPGSEPMRAVDLSARHEIVFQTRGDGREYSVLLLSGESEQGMPAMHGFVAGPDWKEIRLPLAAFSGADPGMLRGIGFSAGMPVGDYRFEVDQVELR